MKCSQILYGVIFTLLGFVSLSCEKEYTQESDVVVEEDATEEDYFPREGAVKEHPLYNMKNAEEAARSVVIPRSLTGFVITSIQLDDFETVDAHGQPFDKKSPPDVQFRFASSFDNLTRSKRSEKSNKFKNASPAPNLSYYFSGKQMPFVMGFLGHTYSLALFDHDPDRIVRKNKDDLMYHFAFSPALIYWINGGFVDWFVIDSEGYRIIVNGYWY